MYVCMYACIHAGGEVSGSGPLDNATLHMDSHEDNTFGKASHSSNQLPLPHSIQGVEFVQCLPTTHFKHAQASPVEAFTTSSPAYQIVRIDCTQLILSLTMPTKAHMESSTRHLSM